MLSPLAGSKGQTFFLLKVVMSHIKFKGTEHKVPCKHMFCPYTHPQAGSKGLTFFLVESSHVAYQIEGNGTQSNMQAHILTLHTPSTPRWG